MAYKFTPAQAAKLDYGLAQAEAISSRSEAQFDRTIQALQDKEKLEYGQEKLNEAAAKAQRDARRRAKRGGLGKFFGTGLGILASLAIPGGGGALAKAAKVLLPAVGGAAGKAAAGGFRDISVGDIDPELREGMTFFKDEGKKLEDAYDDLEYAIDVLDDQNKQQAVIDFGIDAISGLALLKYDNLKIGTGDNAKTLGELRELGKAGSIDYKYKDYLRDVVNLSFGLEPTKTENKLYATDLKGEGLAGTKVNPIFIEGVDVVGDAPYSLVKERRLADQAGLDAVNEMLGIGVDTFPGVDATAAEKRAAGREFLASAPQRRSDEIKKKRNILLNTPLEQLDADSLNQKQALDPVINEQLAKELYEKRGINQWATKDKVTKAFRDATGYTGPVDKDTVSWEQIKKYIADAESSNNPLAIGLNNDGTFDLGLYQINERFLNEVGRNYAVSAIDQRPDQVYQTFQNILNVRTQPILRGF
tara:strand:+ start:4046 stop:5470 length:1425 start_codon:yes stop_codon:yes gene_type:complete